MGLPKFGAGIGLHRMDYLCRDLQVSSWWTDLDPINIVGTNGKGSTAAMVAAILRELGLNTGRFTSPHLFDFSERIQLNGEAISPEALEPLIQHFFQEQALYLRSFPEDQFGAFEAFTSLALHYFFEKKAEAVVLEAGIGGRFDATRICTGHWVGLTSLDLEHTQLLGSTLEQIAMDKLDLAKTGATVILGDLPVELTRKLNSYARLKGITLLSARELSEVRAVVFEKGKMVVDFSVEGLEVGPVRSNLLGRHQLSNMLVAVLLVKKWLGQQRSAVTDAEFIRATQSALNNIQWRGRFEKVSDHPAIYIDVGHTPAAMTHLAQTIREAIKKPILLVFGVSEGRAASPLFRELTDVSSFCILTSAKFKGTQADLLHQTLTREAKLPPTVLVIEPLNAALDRARREAKKRDMTIVVTGSLFLAAEAHFYCQGGDPDKLMFF